ncbi:MAG TPA: sterol desaturase family protein [Chryseolinea sp.]|nr:sterol desaturase family protein [Chryseolinea sp.]
MPSPLDLLLDPVTLGILAIYALLMIWEAIFPGRQLPYVKYWKLRGLLVFAVFFYVTAYVPLLINPFVERFRVLDLAWLGTLGGGIVAVLLYEFGVFVWHYSLHRSDFLWKHFHQMHHSAERLDTYGAFYFSPLDMLGWSVLGSLCFGLIAGFSPGAITVMLLITNFFSIFQHANIRTPQWLGYFVQRPESHTLHHAQGIHRYNYSDLPLFDIIFGTFRNPREFEHETGFYNGASGRIVEMLKGQDVASPRP